MPSSRITLQHFEMMSSLSLLQTIPHYDAYMRGTGTPRPSTIILDYMYGVAAYRRWGSGQEIKEIMERRFTECYKSIPPYLSDDGDANLKSDISPEMLQAMDDIRALSMLLKGTTPELLAAEQQRRAEAEELRAKEATKAKVQQWMQNSESLFVPYLWAISN